jgi:hypothetical protein
MTRESLPIRRRSFLAIVGTSSVVIGGYSLLNRSTTEPTNQPTTERQQFANKPIMNIDQVYQIAQHYYVGPKENRPPAGEAEGTIWEVTDGDQINATRRTLSDGKHWITLNVEPDPPRSSRTPGEYYLTPDDGFKGIQEVIDRTDGNIVVRLAPGTYTGSELTVTHGVILMGSGRNATTIKLEDGANTDLLMTPDPPRKNVMECTLQNITFDGNIANNTAGNLVYGAFWNSRFIDCEFSAAPESGFWLAGSDASTDDNYFNGCQFLDNEGTGLRGGGNKESYPAVGVVRVDTNWFGHNGGPAIVARGNSWKITNSKLYSNAYNRGATIELDRCSYSTVVGCDIYSDRTDRDLVSVLASKGVPSVGNQIKNNDLRGGYRSAIRCFADTNDIMALQVHGNTIQSDGTAVSGIVARSEGRGSFANCSFKDNVFTGVITGSKVVLPDGWVDVGNINAS